MANISRENLRIINLIFEIRVGSNRQRRTFPRRQESFPDDRWGSDTNITIMISSALIILSEEREN